MLKRALDLNILCFIWFHGYFQNLTLDPIKNNYIKYKTDKIWQSYNIKLHI